MLLIAALLTFFIGAAHSVLGERYILIRLFRRTDLPHLQGSDWFTKRTLRFAWHLTTIAWWGSAAQLSFFATRETAADGRRFVLGVLAAVFFSSAMVTVVASRGRHFAWAIFLAIGVLISLTL